MELLVNMPFVEKARDRTRNTASHASPDWRAAPALPAALASPVAFWPRFAAAAFATILVTTLNSAAVQAAPVSSALVSLPPSAGRIIAVDERRDGGDLTQRIVFSGGSSGANFVQIQVGRAAVAPSAGQLASELAGLFPGVAMTPLPGRMLKSRYGVMHVAIGAPDSGGRCLFAWQRIDDLGQTGPGRGAAAGLFRSSTPAAVRIRLCSKTATLDQLAEASEQFMFNVPATAAVEAAPPPQAEMASVSLSPLDDANAAVEDLPRVQLAQAAPRRSRSRSGPILDPASGNPGGLIGWMRGYSRTDPITSSSSPRRGASRDTRFGYSPILGGGGSGSQSGLLGRMNGGSSYSRPPARRQAAPAYAPPRRAARPRPAPAPRRAVSQPRQEQRQETRQEPRYAQPPREPVNVAPAQPQGYQTPSGARYLGPAPGSAPTQAPPAAPQGGAMQAPRVPTPAGAGNAGTAASPVPLPRPAGGQGSQPGGMGARPATQGLDPSLPGRAYRGPGG